MSTWGCGAAEEIKKCGAKDGPLNHLHRCFVHLHRCFDVLAITAMWAAVALFIFVNTSAKEPIPVWQSCKIGRLQCLLAVLFDQCSQLIAIFLSTFCLFLCILWLRNVKPMRKSRRKV
jgi:hypothetical protein